MSPSSYRPDIDGLRGVAVLAVMFFHLGFEGFSGGYVGVDVFFVISGFLITRNIVTDLSAGRFSFARFYVRRARRLFPALFFTLASCFVLGYLLFSPEHLERLGRSLIFSIFSSSNFLFWDEVGYFNPKSHLKPLLHTWSLSVEEQFYLVWPSVLVCLYWFRRSWLVPGFLAVSVLASVYYAEVWLNTDPSAAFYLAPFRVAELGIGALCVWLVSHRPQNENFADLLVAGGLIAITYAALTYDTETRFPGVNALVPSLGAAAIIYAGSTRYAGRLINNRVAVGIGLISYSLYLVHWPMYVFYLYLKDLRIDMLDRVGLVVASMFAAWMMYRFIEQPFRIRRGAVSYLGAPAFGLCCASLALAMTFAAANAWGHKGWVGRFDKEIQPLLSGVQSLRAQRPVGVWARDKESFPEAGRVNAVILGDSHATDMFNALEQNAPHALIKRIGVSTVCQPVVGIRPMENQRQSRKCGRRMEKILDSEKFKAADVIVFSVRWRDWAVELLPETVEALRSVSSAPIIVFGPTVEFKPDVPTLIAKHGKLDGLVEFVNRYRVPARSSLSRRLEALAAQSGVIYIDKISMLCPNDLCPVLVPGTAQLMYVDYGHWSVPGAAYFGKLLKGGSHDLSLLF